MSEKPVPKVAEHNATDPEAPPDGGLTAWTQVLMGHLVFANTWGYIMSYGVFQTYYAENLGRSQSDISWVGSLQMFLLLSIAVVSGSALDSGHFRLVFIIGSIFQALGIFLTSVSNQYWQLLLAQGVCTGIGNGLQFCPAIALVSTYFSKRRSLALGLAATGGGTGGMAYPLIARQLLTTIGFGWTVRVQGFVVLTSSSICIAFLKPRGHRNRNRKTSFVDWRALQDPAFTLFCLGTFLSFWALYFVFYNVGIFGREKLGISRADSITVLLTMNAVSIPGRVLPSYLADRYFGPLNTVIPSTVACSVLIFVWIEVHSKGGLFAFASIYGFMSAVPMSMFPAVISSLSGDASVAGQRLGLGLSFLSIACLTGPPLGGAIIKASGGNYMYAQIWGGSVVVLGGLLLVWARISRTGWNLRSRV